jgi:hypothetical protein
MPGPSGQVNARHARHTAGKKGFGAERHLMNLSPSTERGKRRRAKKGKK